MLLQTSHRIGARSRRVKAATVAAMLLSIVVGSTVFAAAPIRTSTTIDRTRVSTVPCGFAITSHVQATLDDLLFFDASGRLVRVHEVVGMFSTDYTANGHTLTSIGTGILDVYFNPDGSRTFVANGMNELLVLPGQGPIFLDTGHTVSVLDETGFHVEFRAGPFDYDIPAFCAAFA